MMRRILVLVTLVALTMCLGGAVALAQSGGSYNLTWSTVDAGGGTFSTGGAYSVGGTIGQADTGAASGGVYSLVGGFWAFLSGLAPDWVYLPLIQK